MRRVAVERNEMSIRVGINGLGRIGRAYLRYATHSDDVEVVAVNDVADATMPGRLLRRDSTLGQFDKSTHSKSVMIWSLAITVLVTLASVLGLADPNVYGEETKNWATQARGQDLGNLLAVVTLLISGYSYSSGVHRAGLVWLGTLLYLVYAYVVYSMAVHFNELFLVYVAALGLSSYAVIWSVGGLRADNQHFTQPPAHRLAGYTSITIGVLFGLLWLSELIPATVSGEVPQSVIDAGLWVNPIHVIDLALLLPGFIIAGYLTLQGKASGQFFVGPLLVFSVLMGASIVAAMILMTVEGFKNTLSPLIMVMLIVLASLFAAWRYLGSFSNPSPSRSG
jgi:hypothetical protein